MFAKLITVVVLTTAVAASLLGLRQQRLQIMHETAQLHAQIDRRRLQTWDLQVRINERMNPPALRKAIERIALDLEPITPDGPVKTARRIVLAEHGRN